MIDPGKQPLTLTLTIHDEDNLESSTVLLLDQLMKYYSDHTDNLYNDTVIQEQVRIFKHALSKARSGAYCRREE